jgi:Flp pilus assembly protein TadD
MAKLKPVRQRSDFLIYLVLGVAVFAAYSQVVHFDFVGYDDPDYGTANAHVNAGLTWAGISWAFTSAFAANWFPLTWISHMLDWQFFGADAGGQHFTSLCIHAISTLMLFAVLKRMTGARWQSALVAFLFGLHPLHVESVAWIAERKDVLSGLFFVLTLWVYAAYAERPGRVRYLVTLLLFCLGLMAKPMLVTLPIVLILLDYWPLRRGLRIVEKIPFFLAAATVSVVTFLVHRNEGATASLDVVPLGLRLENSSISYVIYVLKMLWPADLGVFYPYPAGSILVPAVVAGVALVAITYATLRALPRHPYLTVGWSWYLLTLVPVIGLVQVGAQARADRYTYIPMIGISIALVWGAAEMLERWPRVQAGLAAAVCLACLCLTWSQLRYWKDSVSLYRHALAVAPDAYLIRFNLASALESHGDHAEAIEQLRETIRSRPGYAAAHAQLGLLVAQEGHPEAALPELRTAVRLRPDLVEAHLGLGSALGTLGRREEAAAEFGQVVRLQPENAGAHYNLGIALAEQGRLPEAAREFGETVRLTPDDAEARFNMGVTLARLGRFDEAITQLREAVRLKPGFAEAQHVLDDVMNLKRR